MSRSHRWILKLIDSTPFVLVVVADDWSFLLSADAVERAKGLAEEVRAGRRAVLAQEGKRVFRTPVGGP